MEEKKKRKPLTVVQSKERRKKKARLEIIWGLNDLKNSIWSWRQWMPWAEGGGGRTTMFEVIEWSKTLIQWSKTLNVLSHWMIQGIDSMIWNIEWFKSFRLNDLKDSLKSDEKDKIESKLKTLSEASVGIAQKAFEEAKADAQNESPENTSEDENVVDELYPYGRHGHGHGHGHGAASGSGVTVTWGSLRLYSEMSGRTAPAFERSMSSLAHRITLWLPARKESNPRSPGPLIYVYLFLSIGPRVELAWGGMGQLPI